MKREYDISCCLVAALIRAIHRRRKSRFFRRRSLYASDQPRSTAFFAVRYNFERAPNWPLALFSIFFFRLLRATLLVTRAMYLFSGLPSAAEQPLDALHVRFCHQSRMAQLALSLGALLCQDVATERLVAAVFPRARLCEPLGG